MASLDVSKLLSELGATIEDNVKDIFEENKGMFQTAGVNSTIELFRHVVDQDESELNVKAYSLFLQSLSDEEFLSLKKQTNKKAEGWVSVDRKRRKLASDLMGISKVAAQTIIKYLIMMA